MAKKNKWGQFSIDTNYDLTDKESASSSYIAYMLNRTQQMFKYENLPDSITKRNLELMLQTNGHVCVASVDGVLYDYAGQTLIRYPKARTNASYTLDDTTRVLANSSFANCTSLTSINFNSGLVAIGSDVFNGASSLNTLTFNSTTPPYLMGFSSFPTNYNLVINYPTGSDNDYMNNLFYNSYRNYLRAN